MWDDGQASVGDEEQLPIASGRGGGESTRLARGAVSDNDSDYKEESDAESDDGGRRRLGTSGRRATRQQQRANLQETTPEDQQSAVTTGSSLLFADACAAFEPQSKTMLTLHEGTHMHVGCVAPFMALLQFIHPAPRMILNLGMHPHAMMAQVRASTSFCGASLA